MAEEKSITIGGQGYRGSMLYWGVVAVVVAVFLLTTISYWSGTLEILDESVGTPVQINRTPKATQ